MIVILGAGLTGLSAAYHLQGHEEVAVLEKEDRPGGLCRSVTKDGFTFDLTGHLLHLRRPGIRALVEDLVPQDRFMRIDRKAFIHSHGVTTPYPFQVNTHGLPPQVVAECVLGFVEAVQSGEVTPEEAQALSFRRWVLRTFGAGIARHFMIPYNEKLWLSDLEDVTCEWVSWSIPRPTLKDVVEGALGLSRKSFGYNPSFLYPKEGGIEILPAALASRVSGIRCAAPVRAVDALRRTVTLDSGETLHWDRLISTIPLPKLLSITDGLPPGLAGAAGRLRHVAVVNINIGVDRVICPDTHWIYFPEKSFIFYRAGFPASFTPAAAPPGCSSIYLEIAVRPDAPYSEPALFEQAREGLMAAGILRASDRVVCRQTFRIDPAYVVYDEARRSLLPAAQAGLAGMGIHSAGRYGGWYYNSMEDSMEDGRRLAAAILDGAAGRAGPSARVTGAG